MIGYIKSSADSILWIDSKHFGAINMLAPAKLLRVRLRRACDTVIPGTVYSIIDIGS